MGKYSKFLCESCYYDFCQTEDVSKTKSCLCCEKNHGKNLDQNYDCPICSFPCKNSKELIVHKMIIHDLFIENSTSET